MIGVKVSKEVNESAFRERFTKVEVVYDNVGISYDTGHIKT